MSESQSQSTLHARLRAATKRSHHNIDHHPVLSPLVSSQLDVEQYKFILQTLYGFHEPLQMAMESACRKFQPDLFFLPSDRRAWLQQDFDFFGISLPDIGSSAPIWDSRDISCNAELIGALYVVEGSTLGGQVIARQLKENFSFGPTTGARLFNGHEGDTYSRWESFWRYASQCPEHEWWRAEDMAAKVFDRLFDTLERAANHWRAIPS